MVKVRFRFYFSVVNLAAYWQHTFDLFSTYSRIKVHPFYRLVYRVLLRIFHLTLSYTRIFFCSDPEFKRESIKFWLNKDYFCLFQALSQKPSKFWHSWIVATKFVRNCGDERDSHYSAEEHRIFPYPRSQTRNNIPYTCEYIAYVFSWGFFGWKKMINFSEQID